MRKILFAAGAILSLLLGGCSALSTASNTTQQLCAAGGTMLNEASASSNAKVSGTAVYGAAFCNTVNAGGTPATSDSNSPAWLQSVITGTQVAAQIGGVVLPLVLGL